jgi:Flp pilus assembly pilin Flp
VQFLNEIIARLTSWTEREEGQTLVEYALIIALVSIALVASLTALAGGITGVFNDIIAAFG